MKEHIRQMTGTEKASFWRWFTSLSKEEACEAIRQCVEEHPEDFYTLPDGRIGMWSDDPKM
jgi:hypothetical protein